MKKIMLGLMLMIMMLATVSAIGLRTNLATPIITYRNLSIGEVVTGEIKGANKNTFPITVSLSVQENKTLELSGTSMELQPDEEFTFEYSKVVEGSETINIGVKYSTTFEEADPKEFNLGSSLTFLVGSDESVQNEEEPVVEENETVTPTPAPTTTTKPKKKSGGGSSSGGGGYNRPLIAAEPEVNITEKPTPLNDTDNVDLFGLNNTGNFPVDVNSGGLNITPVVTDSGKNDGTVLPLDEDAAKTKSYAEGTVKFVMIMVIFLVIYILYLVLKHTAKPATFPEEYESEENDKV